MGKNKNKEQPKEQPVQEKKDEAKPAAKEAQVDTTQKKPVEAKPAAAAAKPVANAEPKKPADYTLLIVLVAHSVIFAIFMAFMLTMQGEETVLGQIAASARGFAADIGRQFTEQTPEMQMGVGSVAGVWFLASNFYILKNVIR